MVALVRKVAGPQRTPVKVQPDTPLADGGFCLSSVDLLEVVLACEASFWVVLDPATDLDQENLLTIGSLSEMIQRAIDRRSNG